MTLCQLTLYDTIRHQIEDPSGSVRNYSDLVNQILECKVQRCDLNSSHTHNVDAMLICSHTCHHIMCGQLCNSLHISVRILMS